MEVSFSCKNYMVMYTMIQNMIYISGKIKKDATKDNTSTRKTHSHTHFLMPLMKAFATTDSDALLSIADDESYGKGLSSVVLVQ